jgi:hypothetical protein
MITIGFTGTQKGMTKAQYRNIIEFIMRAKWGPDQFAHGDCIGADEDLHNLVSLAGLPITIYPPINESKRAFCRGGFVMEAKDYLERNHDIVDACNVLWACPSGMQEELRSGTWATIRYARKQNKPVVIFYPDGSVA